MKCALFPSCLSYAHTCDTLTLRTCKHTYAPMNTYMCTCTNARPPVTHLKMRADKTTLNSRLLAKRRTSSSVTKHFDKFIRLIRKLNLKA